MNCSCHSNLNNQSQSYSDLYVNLQSFTGSANRFQTEIERTVLIFKKLPNQCAQVRKSSPNRPKIIRQFVKKDLNAFTSDGRRIPLAPNYYYSTNEGRQAWQQAYQYLCQVKPVPAYKQSKGLQAVAQIHVQYLQDTNSMSHQDGQGMSSMQRIQKYCTVKSNKFATAENIGNDFNQKGRNHALEVVKGLIIDDGVSNRGHRRNIFSTEYQYIGIASRIVEDKVRVVMDFCNTDPELKSNVNVPKGKTPSQSHHKQQKNFYSQEGNDDWNQKGQGFGGGFNVGLGGFKQQHFGGFQQQGFGGGFDDGFGGFNNKPMGFGQFQQQSWQGGFSDNQNDHGHYQDHFNQIAKGNKPSNSSNKSGGKYAVSTKKSSSTRTVNGKKQTVTIETITYSDGSVETNENRETY